MPTHCPACGTELRPERRVTPTFVVRIPDPVLPSCGNASSARIPQCVGHRRVSGGKPPLPSSTAGSWSTRPDCSISTSTTWLGPRSSARSQPAARIRPYSRPASCWSPLRRPSSVRSGGSWSRSASAMWVRRPRGTRARFGSLAAIQQAGVQRLAATAGIGTVIAGRSWSGSRSTGTRVIVDSWAAAGQPRRYGRRVHGRSPASPSWSPARWRGSPRTRPPGSAGTRRQSPAARCRRPTSWWSATIRVTKHDKAVALGVTIIDVDGLRVLLEQGPGGCRPGTARSVNSSPCPMRTPQQGSP